MHLDAQWIVGFVDGEGRFKVSLNKLKEIQAEFTVVQHEQDVQILFALKTHFGCGVVRKTHSEKMCYRVKEVKHLLNKIIPFFEKHLLKTKKRVEFQKFRKILLKIQRNDHLNADGLEEIQSIVEQMTQVQTKIESDSFGNKRD